MIEDTELRAFYRVEGDVRERSAVILGESIDREAKIATLDISLPQSFAAKSLEVYVKCLRNGLLGQASNSTFVSNCEYQAHFDTDQDGLDNTFEDVNCDGEFNFGDISSSKNLDTDGDGIRDFNELIVGERSGASGGQSASVYFF